MTASPILDWRSDFGIQDRMPPNLFTRKEQLTRTTPQAHLIRRAFDVLEEARRGPLHRYRRWSTSNS